MHAFTAQIMAKIPEGFDVRAMIETQPLHLYYGVDDVANRMTDRPSVRWTDGLTDRSKD